VSSSSITQQGAFHKSRAELLFSVTGRHTNTCYLMYVLDEPIDEDKLVKYLFTLGEVTLLCPQRTPKRVFWLVKSLIAAPTIPTASQNGRSSLYSALYAILWCLVL